MAQDSLGAAWPFNPVLQHLRLFWSMRPWLQATRTFIFLQIASPHYNVNVLLTLKRSTCTERFIEINWWSFRNFVCFVHQTMLQHRHEEDVSGFTTIPMVASLQHQLSWLMFVAFKATHPANVVCAIAVLHRKEKLSNLALPFAISALFTGILIWLAGWLAIAGSDAWPSTKRWSSGKCNGKLQRMNTSVDISRNKRRQSDWNSCAG